MPARTAQLNGDARVEPHLRYLDLFLPPSPPRCMPYIYLYAAASPLGVEIMFKHCLDCLIGCGFCTGGCFSRGLCCSVGLCCSTDFLIKLVHEFKEKYPESNIIQLITDGACRSAFPLVNDVFPRILMISCPF